MIHINIDTNQIADILVHEEFNGFYGDLSDHLTITEAI